MIEVALLSCTTTVIYCITKFYQGTVRYMCCTTSVLTLSCTQATPIATYLVCSLISSPSALHLLQNSLLTCPLHLTMSSSDTTADRLLLVTVWLDGRLRLLAADLDVEDWSVKDKQRHN